MKKFIFSLVFSAIFLVARAKEDSILFRQEIARWDMSVKKAFQGYNSLGFVTLTADSLLFESNEHKMLFNFSICYADIISVRKAALFFIVKIKRSDGKVFKIGGTRKIKSFMKIFREQLDKRKTKTSAQASIGVTS
ncbi:MAG: hypothetical protein MUC38_15715 [Cyclobacteriaceae bacterium]|jgi:hypothetical protein|nr:hypothetical protein [Cyclobacteriaceae bacterium]